ncbi:MAG TPA: rhodanese-like domain-containing protein [SAR86 cluster bacterium]|nr:rhodanese-like domain-containing protein [SAR86 cluster bacterium]|tara:strand:- start:17025 stop:17447 length:423 start_codon:yes stop_codon:yes gene_type:complete
MEKFTLFIADNSFVVLLLLTLIIALLLYEKRKGGLKIDANELTRLINKESPYVFDLRSSSEYDLGTISGAVNINPSDLMKGNAQFKAKEEDNIVLICKTGSSSNSAANNLKKGGYINVSILSGGIMGWIQSGMPLTKKQS